MLRNSMRNLFEMSHIFFDLRKTYELILNYVLLENSIILRIILKLTQNRQINKILVFFVSLGMLHFLTK